MFWGSKNMIPRWILQASERWKKFKDAAVYRPASVSSPHLPWREWKVSIKDAPLSMSTIKDKGKIMTSIFALLLAVLMSASAVAVDGELTRLTEADLDAFPLLGDYKPIKFIARPQHAGFGKLQLIDPRRYDFHHDFMHMTYKQLRAISYEAKNRQLILGTILYNPKANSDADSIEGRARFLFSLTTQDVPDIKVLSSIFEASTNWLKKHSDIDPQEAIQFRPQPQQEAEVTSRLAEFQKAGIPVLFADRPEGMYVYNVGWGLGQMKAFNTAEDVAAGISSGAINPDTVMVVGTDLGELPPVAGVISTVPLTEASHMVLLAQMYGIPIVYQKNGLELNRNNFGKWAVLQTVPTNENYFELYAGLSMAEVESLRLLKVRAPLKDLTVDGKTKAIVEVASLQADQVPAYGGKSVKFGLIRRTIPEYTRSVVAAIPVYYYQRFLESEAHDGGVTVGQKLNEMLEALESKETRRKKGLSAEPSYAEVDQVMADIRKMIKKAKIKAKLVHEIRTALKGFFPTEYVAGPFGIIQNRLKLRSSSNVEDGAEFNGAGLYESEGVCLDNCWPGKDDFAAGLKKVWGSLYTTRGYWARRQFGVNEAIVGMGIVAQKPYKGELANGVVKFTKFTDQNDARVEILGVRGEDESITAGSGLNERVVMKEMGNIQTFRPLQHETIPMMSLAHYDKLFELMQKLYGAWPGDKGDDLEIEAEWKLIIVNGQERVNIKQVRAVPRPKSPAREGDRRMITGEDSQMEFAVKWPTQARAMAWKPEKAVIKMKPLTDGQFVKGQFKVDGVQLTIRDQVYDVEVGALVAEDPNEYVTIFTASLTHPQLPKMRLQIALSKEVSTPVVTPRSLFWNFEIFPLNHRGDMITGVYTLVDPAQGPEIDELVSDDLSFRLELAGCPLKIQGKMTQLWPAGDNAIGSMDEVSIEGALRGGRKIVLKGYPLSFYTYNWHSGSRSAWLDLFGDPSLSKQDKDALKARYGRYLSLEGTHLKAISEDLKSEKILPNCGVEDGNAGGAE